MDCEMKNTESTDGKVIPINTSPTDKLTNEETNNITSSCEVLKIEDSTTAENEGDPTEVGTESSSQDRAPEFETDTEDKKSSIEKPSSAEKLKKHKKKNKRPERYKKRRSYKPYLRLSWIEQQKREERVSRRAQRVRDEMMAHGLPLAPYNTTQFIISDHNVEEPDYEKIQRDTSARKYNYEDSPELYQNVTEDEEWANEQFCEVYERFRAEYFEGLSKVELAEQLLRLEDEIEEAEKHLKSVRQHKISMGLDDKDPDAEVTKINVLRDEIMKLVMENKSLYSQNMELREILTSDCSE